MGAFVAAGVLLLFKRFFFVSFDEEVAEAQGLRVRWINLALVVLAAITISLAMCIVGILLMGALMVIPVITSMQYGRSFRQTFSFSIVLSVFSVLAGLFLSYDLDLASGGTIVVVALVIFVLSLLANRKRA